MFSSAAAAMALSRVRGLPAISLMTVAFGMTSELYRPASAALLTDLVPPKRRLTAFAGYRLAINAGFAAGPAAAGFLAARSYYWLFVGEAVTSVVLGIVALVALPEGVRSRRSEEGSGAALRVVGRDRPFMLFLLASEMAAFVYFQSGSTLPLFVKELGFSPAVYGALISLNGALIVLFELPLTRFVRRFSAPRAIATGVALTGIGFALTAVSKQIAPLVGTVVIWTVGEMVAAPTGQAYVSELAPDRLRGRYQGAFGLTFASALILAPYLGTRLFAWSPTGLWLICGALGLACASLTWNLPGRRAQLVIGPTVGPEIPGAERQG
jgi:MFS family permease